MQDLIKGCGMFVILLGMLAVVLAARHLDIVAMAAVSVLNVAIPTVAVAAVAIYAINRSNGKEVHYHNTDNRQVHMHHNSAPNQIDSTPVWDLSRYEIREEIER